MDELVNVLLASAPSSSAGSVDTDGGLEAAAQKLESLDAQFHQRKIVLAMKQILEVQFEEELREQLFFTKGGENTKSTDAKDSRKVKENYRVVDQTTAKKLADAILCNKEKYQRVEAAMLQVIARCDADSQRQEIERKQEMSHEPNVWTLDDLPSGGPLEGEECDEEILFCNHDDDDEKLRERQSQKRKKGERTTTTEILFSADWPNEEEEEENSHLVIGGDDGSFTSSEDDVEGNKKQINTKSKKSIEDQLFHPQKGHLLNIRKALQIIVADVVERKKWRQQEEAGREVRQSHFIAMEEEASSVSSISNRLLFRVLENMDSTDVMNFEHWDLVVGKLISFLLDVEFEEDSLVHIADLFANAGAEQAGEMYLAFTQHISKGVSGEEQGLGAKLTIAWRMQQDLCGHWMCFSKELCEGIVRNTFELVTRHWYAVGVVDPYASWAESLFNNFRSALLCREMGVKLGMTTMTKTENISAAENISTTSTHQGADCNIVDGPRNNNQRISILENVEKSKNIKNSSLHLEEEEPLRGSFVLWCKAMAKQSTHALCCLTFFIFPDSIPFFLNFLFEVEVHQTYLPPEISFSIASHIQRQVTSHDDRRRRYGSSRGRFSWLKENFLGAKNQQGNLFDLVRQCVQCIQKGERKDDIDTSHRSNNLLCRVVIPDSTLSFVNTTLLFLDIFLKAVVEKQQAEEEMPYEFYNNGDDEKKNDEQKNKFKCIDPKGIMSDEKSLLLTVPQQTEIWTLLAEASTLVINAQSLSTHQLIGSILENIASSSASSCQHHIFDIWQEIVLNGQLQNRVLKSKFRSNNKTKDKKKNGGKNNSSFHKDIPGGVDAHTPPPRSSAADLQPHHRVCHPSDNNITSHLNINTKTCLLSSFLREETLPAFRLHFSPFATLQLVSSGLPALRWCEQILLKEDNNDNKNNNRKQEGNTDGHDDSSPAAAARILKQHVLQSVLRPYLGQEECLNKKMKKKNSLLDDHQAEEEEGQEARSNDDYFDDDFFAPLAHHFSPTTNLTKQINFICISEVLWETLLQGCCRKLLEYIQCFQTSSATSLQKQSLTPLLQSHPSSYFLSNTFVPSVFKVPLEPLDHTTVPIQRALQVPCRLYSLRALLILFGGGAMHGSSKYATQCAEEILFSLRRLFPPTVATPQKKTTATEDDDASSQRGTTNNKKPAKISSHSVTSADVQKRMQQSSVASVEEVDGGTDHYELEIQKWLKSGSSLFEIDSLYALTECCIYFSTRSSLLLLNKVEKQCQIFLRDILLALLESRRVKEEDESDTNKKESNNNTVVIMMEPISILSAFLLQKMMMVTDEKKGPSSFSPLPNFLSVLLPSSSISFPLWTSTSASSTTTENFFKSSQDDLMLLLMLTQYNFESPSSSSLLVKLQSFISNTFVRNMRRMENKKTGTEEDAAYRGVQGGEEGTGSKTDQDYYTSQQQKNNNTGSSSTSTTFSVEKFRQIILSLKLPSTSKDVIEEELLVLVTPLKALALLVQEEWMKDYANVGLGSSSSKMKVDDGNDDDENENEIEEGNLEDSDFASSAAPTLLCFLDQICVERFLAIMKQYFPSSIVFLEFHGLRVEYLFYRWVQLSTSSAKGKSKKEEITDEVEKEMSGDEEATRSTRNTSHYQRGRTPHPPSVGMNATVNNNNLSHANNNVISSSPLSPVTTISSSVQGKCDNKKRKKRGNFEEEEDKENDDDDRIHFLCCFLALLLHERCRQEKQKIISSPAPSPFSIFEQPQNAAGGICGGSIDASSLSILICPDLVKGILFYCSEDADGKKGPVAFWEKLQSML